MWHTCSGHSGHSGRHVGGLGTPSQLGNAPLARSSAVTPFVAAPPPTARPSWALLLPLLLATACRRLTGIGVGIGLAFAWVLGYVLKLLRWRGAKAYVESIVVLATAYLAFYVAQASRRHGMQAELGGSGVAVCAAVAMCLGGSSRQHAAADRSSSNHRRADAATPHYAVPCFVQAPAKGSGVIAVCVFGLYGSASGHWGMLATDAGGCERWIMPGGSMWQRGATYM